MKTAISIPDPLFKQVERLRKKLRISRSELFARAAERFIAELNQPDVRTMSDHEITEALNRSLDEEQAVDPVLGALQQRAARESW